MYMILCIRCQSKWFQSLQLTLKNSRSKKKRKIIFTQRITEVWITQARLCWSPVVLISESSYVITSIIARSTAWSVYPIHQCPRSDDYKCRRVAAESIGANYKEIYDLYVVPDRIVRRPKLWGQDQSDDLLFRAVHNIASVVSCMATMGHCLTNNYNLNGRQSSLFVLARHLTLPIPVGPSGCPWRQPRMGFRLPMIRIIRWFKLLLLSLFYRLLHRVSEEVLYVTIWFCITRKFNFFFFIHILFKRPRFFSTVCSHWFILKPCSYFW